MLVSWKWLSRYVQLSMDVNELEDRLSFSGLNHEATETIGDDVVIDLEVTSNRGDCLGHLGVAREIGVLYDLPVCRPEPNPATSGPPITSALQVDNQFVEACPRYTARLVRGVQVGPSPDRVVESLAAVGIRSVNNIVDATNYVMLECGQPLHAFDYAKVSGNKIIVRRGSPGETMQAIDHREYELDAATCVIADADRASAVAGVMGGAISEVTDATRDLVIESAVFTPLSVRRTARRLKLHSPSSYRFERRVDPAGVDWASRRVCELIVEWAGGEIAPGVIDTAPDVPPPSPITLRPGQLERILGLKIDDQEVERILTALGCQTTTTARTYVPPSWRHDLTREADLIEEVARIHGYDKIPSNAPVPVTPSARRPFDTAMERVRWMLTAAGLSEAMTPSVVTSKLDESTSPWTERPALRTQTSMLEGAQRLRRSLIPSLLNSRAHNWASAGVAADLFEIAHIYLPQDSDDALPVEEYCLGMVCGGDYFRLKGIIEILWERMGVGEPLQVEPVERDGMVSGSAVELRFGNTRLGLGCP
jgi:phenylalanyl-tRNA synthetase beta chain